MAEEKVGIKETVEVFDAVPAFIKVLKDNLSNGVQVTDAINIAAGMLASPVVEAFNDAGKIPAELADIDIYEAEQITNAATKAAFATLRLFKGASEESTE